jgi:hypothetical protein
MADQGSSEPPPRFRLDVRKWDVVDTLRREHGLRHLVQILTPSTGPDMHGRPELQRFAAVTTLLYASDQHRREMPEAAGLPTLDDLERSVARHRPHADIVFIDSWHTYAHSVRVLALALRMLADGGFVVMHDCDPPDMEAAVPEPESCFVLWCGEAWRAFLDTAESLPGCRWWVVESDLGVGVIEVPPPSWRRRLLGRRGLAPRVKASRIPSSPDASWQWFVEHRAAVLHLVSIEAWQERASRVDLA